MSSDQPPGSEPKSVVPDPLPRGMSLSSLGSLLESHVNNLQTRRNELLNRADVYLKSVSKLALENNKSTIPTAGPQPVSSDRFRLSGNVIGDEADNPPPLPGLGVRIVDASGKIFENPAWQTDETGRFNLDVSQSELGSAEGGFTLELADAQGNRVQTIDVPVEFGRSITVEPRVRISADSSLNIQAELGLSMAESVARAAAQREDQKKQIATWRALTMLDLDRRLAASAAALRALPTGTIQSLRDHVETAREPTPTGMT